MRIRQWEYQFVVLWAFVGMAARLLSGKDLIRYFVPAIPPTALLVGLAVAGVCAHILKRVQKHPRLLASAVCVALMLPSAGYAFNTDVVMRQPDARDRAAAWLAANVSAQEVMGVVGNLYWYNPPINAETYLIRNLKERSAGPLPRVCVTSSAARRGIREYLDGAQRADFATYTPTVFEQRPSWVWAWPAEHYPEDWQYTFCDITVFTCK